MFHLKPSVDIGMLPAPAAPAAPAAAASTLATQTPLVGFKRPRLVTTPEEQTPQEKIRDALVCLQEAHDKYVKAELAVSLLIDKDFKGRRIHPLNMDEI